MFYFNFLFSCLILYARTRIKTRKISKKKGKSKVLGKGNKFLTLYKTKSNFFNHKVQWIWRGEFIIVQF